MTSYPLQGFTLQGITLLARKFAHKLVGKLVNLQAIRERIGQRREGTACSCGSI
jgi:hypothetical protein